MIYGDDHYTKDYPHKDQVTKFLKGDFEPAILTNPFPPQKQQLITQNPAPSQGG